MSSTISTGGRDGAHSRSRSRTTPSRHWPPPPTSSSPIHAGEERAVAATKTYVAEVATLGLLAAHVAGRGERLPSAFGRQPRFFVTGCRRPRRQWHSLAPEFAPVKRMLVVGRGPAFGTAREIALKLLETCRVAAAALTATDLAHGPVAALDGLFPVWAVAGNADAGLRTVDRCGDPSPRCRGYE